MQLRQDALAEEFGVSRIPVREALVQLEAEGLVRIQPHKGAVVANLSPDDILELFEFRSLIQPRLLERSAAQLTQQEFGQLDGILEAYSAELRSLQITRWGMLNTQLHTLLYSHAEAPQIEATAQQLLQSCDRFTGMQIHYTDGHQRAEQEHSQIVQLCKKRDIAAAAETLRMHILTAGDELSKHLAGRKRHGG